VFGFALGLVAGGVAVLLHAQAARALIEFVLQPGSSGALLLPEEPATVVLFPLRLFGLAFLAVAACVFAAWTVAGGRTKAVMFLILFGASSMLTVLALWVYRGQMQESVEVRVGAQVLERTRAQMTRLGDIPILQLGLIGPAIVCVGAVAVRRRKAAREAHAG
jgi:hypothetical protein